MTPPGCGGTPWGGWLIPGVEDRVVLPMLDRNQVVPQTGQRPLIHNPGAVGSGTGGPVRGIALLGTSIDHSSWSGWVEVGATPLTSPCRVVS